MQVFKGKVFSLLFLHLFLMDKSDSYFMPSGPRLHGSGHFIHINICCREEQEVSTDPTALLSLMNRLEMKWDRSVFMLYLRESKTQADAKADFRNSCFRVEKLRLSDSFSAVRYCEAFNISPCPNSLGRCHLTEELEEGIFKLVPLKQTERKGMMQ